MSATVTTPEGGSPEAPVTLVASDLDRTLIYSAAALQLTMPDDRAPRLLCVEVYDRAPLCYMTETAAALLGELARTTVFVPTTTRTREQYGRIHLPGPAPRYAICANGGHILVDGVSDPDWQQHVTGRISGECASLAEVRAHLQAASDPSWLLKERVAEDLFAYLVVDRAALPEGWVKELTAWADPKGWSVSLQGRKIYVVPKPLTKSAAMHEVARRTGATRTLAMRRLTPGRRPAARRRPGLAPGPRRARRLRLGRAEHRGAQGAGCRRGRGDTAPLPAGRRHAGGR